MLTTSRKPPFHILVLACGLLFAGCSSLRAPPPEPARYVCDEGRQFSIAFLPDAGGANIEINRMRFHLRRETAPTGARYACDVLAFTGSGETAEVAIQDAPAYRNCRLAR